MRSLVQFMDYASIRCSECQEQIDKEDTVLETSALKNPFCRRSPQDRRSNKERRTNVDSIKQHFDRRSGVDRRKSKDRRKHDYWNTNYRYWYGDKQ
jgi:hypothetical protein